jgi:hypothetical protein
MAGGGQGCIAADASRRSDSSAGRAGRQSLPQWTKSGFGARRARLILPPPSGKEPVMSEPIDLSDFRELSREDTVDLNQSAAADPANVEFVLETIPSVTWWKAIELRSRGGAMIEQRETQAGNHGPHEFSVPASSLVGARLTLAKAKLFGIHTGMYELQNLSALRGRRLHFLWQRDDDQDGPVAGFFRDLGRPIAAAADTIGNAAAAVFDWIGDAIGAIFESIGNFIAGILDAIGDLLGNIPLIGPFLRGLFHWLGTIVAAAFDLVGTFFKAIFNFVGAFLAGLVRVVLGGIGGLLAWDGRIFVEGLGDMLAGFLGAVFAIFLKAVGFIESIFGGHFAERVPTQAELGMLANVYRSSVNLANVRIIDGREVITTVNGGRAITIGNKIYMAGTMPSLYDETLVHECCHVWQNQHVGTRYLADALGAQIFVRPDAYRWQDEPGRGNHRWQDFNREAQAEFIMDVFKSGTHVSLPARQGIFFDADPIGDDVRFFDGAQDRTGLARETMLHVRG